MELSNNFLNNLFKSKFLNYFPKRIIRLLIKKNKIFFIKIDLKSLPKINYPFLLSLKDLEEKKEIFSKNEFKIPTNEFPYLGLILKLIFQNKDKFKFLDFGAQYIDNYFFLKNKNNNINYVYHDLIENNKVVEEFININELKNIEVVYNLNEIKKNKFDFIYFGSVIQYVNEYQNLINELTAQKPKYLYFSGVNFFFKNNYNTIVCKQFNVFPQINYCYFFNFDYLKNLVCSKNYELVYFSENSNSKINYSLLNESIDDNCKYLDLFFKIKD